MFQATCAESTLDGWELAGTSLPQSQYERPFVAERRASVTAILQSTVVETDNNVLQ